MGGGRGGGHGGDNHRAMQHLHNSGATSMVGGWGPWPVALGSADPTDDDRLPEAPIPAGCLAKLCAAMCTGDRPRGIPDDAVLLPLDEQRDLLSRFQGARAARCPSAALCAFAELPASTHAGTHARRWRRRLKPHSFASRRGPLPPKRFATSAQAHGRSSR